MRGIRPGYHSGFAPRDGEPLHPQLLRNCVGAWAPLLGPSGTTLRDNSPVRNHGALTNMDPASDWVVSGGNYALDFDGSNDYVLCSRPVPDGSCSFAAWVNFTSASANLFFCGSSNSGDNTPLIWLGIGNVGTLMRWFVRGASSGTEQNSSVALNTGTWRHVCGTYNAISGEMKSYIDGVETASGTVTPGAITLTNTSIGAAVRTTVGSYFSGNLNDVLCYSRTLTGAEVRLLATRPGIAYEMQRRRRSSSQVTAGFLAAWAARQKTQLLGGGIG